MPELGCAAPGQFLQPALRGPRWVQHTSWVQQTSLSLPEQRVPAVAMLTSVPAVI